MILISFLFKVDIPDGVTSRPADLHPLLFVLGPLSRNNLLHNETKLDLVQIPN
jgi:hypothetical protein